MNVVSASAVAMEEQYTSEPGNHRSMFETSTTSSADADFALHSCRAIALDGWTASEACAYAARPSQEEVSPEFMEGMPMDSRKYAGSPDPRFGDNGHVRLFVKDHVNGSSQLLSDGKILSVGNGGSGGVSLVKHLPGGALDVAFGEGGIKRTDLGLGREWILRDHLVLKGDKLLLAGDAIRLDETSTLIYARLLPNGDLDSTFGKDGVVEIDLPLTPFDQTRRMAVQPDGKIVGAIRSSYGPGSMQADNGLLRLNPDGSLDRAFGSGGVSYEFPPGSSLWDVTVLADGKLLLSGLGRNGGMLSRYDPNGNPDPSFGSGGHFYFTVSTNPDSNQVNKIGVQHDNKIVIVGSAGLPGSQIGLMARVEPDGSGFDTTFNDGKPLLLPLEGRANSEQDVAIQKTDGKIVSLGAVFGTQGPTTLRRFNVDGTPDRSFGVEGLVTEMKPEGVFDIMTSLQIDEEGRYLVSGSVFDFSEASRVAQGSNLGDMVWQPEHAVPGVREQPTAMQLIGISRYLAR
ncbi:delta-60 repeat domain-containing protein [Luteibacter jiangsuensis]